MNDDRLQIEQKRVRRMYEQRRNLKFDYHDMTHPWNRYRTNRLDQLFQQTRQNLSLHSHSRVLEIGCGAGDWFRRWQGFPESPILYGIDLDEERLGIAHSTYPIVRLALANAGKIPFPDETFDVVFQSTVFTSILDESVRMLVANEMNRVLRRNGFIVWYDFRMDNPRNSDVRRVTLSAFQRYFPGHSFRARHVMLAPPLARPLSRLHPAIPGMVEKLRFLNSHLWIVSTRSQNDANPSALDQSKH